MISDLLYRLRALFRRRSMDAELDEELRAHIEHDVEKHVQAGLPREEAARPARLQFGGLDQVKEECRDVRGVSLIETTTQDVHYGLRMLRKNPGFTTVAVITLALGIGGNTAIFSVVNAFLLRPLPYKDAARLVRVAETTQYQGREGLLHVSAPDFMDWRNSNRVFEDMAAEMSGNFELMGGDLAENVHGASVSTNFFSVLGVRPILGRTFLPDDGQPGYNLAVILSYGAWERLFGFDPKVIGRRLELGGGTHTVVGVLPRNFEFTKGFSFDTSFDSQEQVDVWLPLVLTGGMLTDREFHPLWVIARLAPDATLGEARAELTTVARRLSQEYPNTNGTIGVSLISLKAQEVKNIRPALLMLLSAVGLLLLIACANVANLSLARGMQRARETSIRIAIGCSRSRLIRQFLTESVLLASLGGCIGLLLGLCGTKLLIAIVPGGVPRIATVGVDGTVAAFTLVISLFTGIVFGLFPAFQASKPLLNEYLKDAGASATAGAHSRRAHNALMVFEISMALVLLIGAGLLIQSFWRLLNGEIGFNPANLLTLKLSLPESRYPAQAQLVAFEQELLDQTRSLPGVEYVAAASPLPLSGTNMRAQFNIEGRALPQAGQEPEVDYAAVTPDYFQAMGTPILRGRPFTAADTGRSVAVVIINETMARQLWANGDPIGKHITVFSLSGQISREVVGVAGQVKYQGLGEATVAQIYVPYAQDPSNSLYIVVRTHSQPKDIALAVRLRVAGLDKNLPVQDVMTMEERISRLVTQPRLYAALLGTFAALGLMLATVGIYGVVAYSVAQRTHEVGVRVALGAQRRDVLRLVVGQGMLLALIGVGIGCLEAVNK